MVLLEIEQKFRFTPSLCQFFRLNKGHPPFSSLKSLGTHRFYDIYFDRSQILAQNGVWIRKRDDKWEAKRRIEGNFIRTAFEEIDDSTRIHSLVCQYLPGSPDERFNFGLDVSCQFGTTRQLYV